jgi:Protein of unknown function (DUF2971)
MQPMNETVGLFKYLDASKLVFFENCLVLLTPPIYLNDPWDFLPKGRVPSEDEILKVWREIETDIARSSVITLPADYAQREQRERFDGVRAGVTSEKFIGGWGEHYQKEIGRFIGIVSLTELPLSRLMWAHYADSHKGFVAEFAAGEETAAYGFTIRMCAVGPVVAAKVKYHPDFQQISKKADNVHEVIWSKHPDWEKEKEWRIICPLQHSIARQVNRPGGELLKRYLLPFAPVGLRRVIFGMRMEVEVKQRLCNMLGREEFKHVQKQVTDIDPQSGEMVLNPL